MKKFIKNHFPETIAVVLMLSLWIFNVVYITDLKRTTEGLGGRTTGTGWNEMSRVTTMLNGTLVDYPVYIGESILDSIVFGRNYNAATAEVQFADHAYFAGGNDVDDDVLFNFEGTALQGQYTSLGIGIDTGIMMTATYQTNIMVIYIPL